MKQSEKPHTWLTRLGYLAVGVAMITLGITLIVWCLSWLQTGAYEYVIFNGPVGIIFAVIGIDYLIDACS